MIKPGQDMKLVPAEMYSTKGKTAEDAILQQLMVYNLARQLKHLLVVASVDVSQCYNRVAHSMKAVTLQAYKV